MLPPTHIIYIKLLFYVAFSDSDVTTILSFNESLSPIVQQYLLRMK